VWNPAAGLFPFLLLMFLAWSLACGDHRLLPLTALVASFVTQTHLMYAAPTAVLLAVGCGGLLIGRLRGRRPAAGRQRLQGRIWPWALAALVLAAACWTAPAIDELEHNPGNLTMIVRTAEHHGRELGASVGWNAVVRSVGVHPWWLHVPASEWGRKGDVRHASSTAAVDSAIAILAALALAGVLGAWRGRRDLAAGAAIGLGLSGAIALEAAANPAAQLLAETLGYTMWWGSELGFWVWLMLAWALWLGLGAARRAGVRALRRRRGAGRVAPAWLPKLAGALTTLLALLGIAVVGIAVAHTAKPDSHVYEYRPTRALAAGIERVLPKGVAVAYRFGPLGLGTQPMEPAIRFLLVRHGDRPLARGSYPRLGSYYEPDGRPVRWVVDLRDGVARQRGMTLAARVRFASPWREEVVSAWVGRSRA
jgi:hypothetical protein